MTVSRLTLAKLLGVTPSSSAFRDAVASARFYGLTTGGINSNEFGLTKRGEEATGADEVAQVAALKAAVMEIPPYKAFFQTFNGKKVPGRTALKEFLTRDASVADSRADECIDLLLADAKVAGLVQNMKGGNWVDLGGVPEADAPEDDQEGDDVADDLAAEEESGKEEATVRGPAEEVRDGSGTGTTTTTPKVPPAIHKKVFIAHGKNRTPLDQLKKALDQFKVEYAVAVDEPHGGRPISKKVADLMRDQCSSGILIFTADERFVRENKDGEQEEVWRPSENVVYELGAASILYENRIVIFKEKGVSFPSDFSDLGYIEFEKDQLATEMSSLFAELVNLDILEVRAKAAA